MSGWFWRGRSPVTSAMLLVLACGALGGCDGEVDAPHDEPPPVAPPWASGEARTCPVASADPAARRDLARQAEALWQRAEFDWGDAARAEQRLAQAFACARRDAALDALDRYAARLRRWRDELQRRVDQEALRVELAVREEDPDKMARHAQRLAEVLRLSAGPDAERSRRWLENVQRRARALAAEARREEEED